MALTSHPAWDRSLKSSPSPSPGGRPQCLPPKRPTVPYVAPSRQLTRKESYRPLLHRTIPLAVLAGVVLALIGVLEFSIRSLPQTPAHPALQGRHLAAFAAATPDPTGPPGPPGPHHPPPPPPSGGPPPPSGPPPDSSSPTQTASPQPEQAQTPTQTLTTEVNVPATQHTSAVTQTAQAAQAETQADSTHGVSATSTPSGDAQPVSSSSTSVVGLANVAAATTPVTSASSSEPSAATGGSQTTTDDRPVDSGVPLMLADDSSVYFLGIYLPVLIASALRLIAAAIYRYTKLIDPFVMLSRPNGALLKDFFNADHLGSASLTSAWSALRGSRWTVLWTAILYGLTQLLTLVVSELNTIYPSNYSANSTVPTRGDALWVNATVARIIQAILALLFIQIVIVWALFRKSQSGLNRNPASLATIATLVGHPGTASGLLSASTLADYNIVKALGDHRYRLQSYNGPNQREVTGIVPIDVRYEDLHSDRFSPASSTTTVAPTGTVLSNTCSRRDKFSLASLTLVGTVLLGIIAAYGFAPVSSNPTNFDQFMDPRKFGPRFLLTALALILKAPLLAICTRVTASISYSRLAAQPRHADLDLVAPVPLTPLGSIWYAARRSAWLALSYAVTGGVLVEVLILLLPGIPFKAVEAYFVAPRISWVGSVLCLAIILLLVVVSWVYVIFKHGLIDRRAPKARLGPFLMSVAGTKMAADSALDKTESNNKTGGTLYELRYADVQRWVVDYAKAKPKEDYFGPKD